MAKDHSSDSIVALIPARGGSKSIPLKNIRPIAGRPLIYWVLDAATRSKYIDVVYVATEDERIARVVEAYGGGVRVFRRSPSTATDEAPTEAVLLEFASKHVFDHICLIQATSPLLTWKDLDDGLRQYLQSGSDSLLSVVRQKRFLWAQTDDASATPLNYDPARRPRRQEFDGFLVENGAFYVTSREALLRSNCRISGRITLYEMPEDTYLELDEPDDWAVVETLLARRRRDEWVSRLKAIKVLAFDVDGVLTDGGMYYSDTGAELKKFNTRDGKGIELIRSLGIIPAIITGETTPIVSLRAQKLGITEVYQGVSDKRQILAQLTEKLCVAPEEVAYIGDDLNDLDVIRTVGFGAVPADARPELKAAADYICQAGGGHGCVREVCDLIVEAQRTRPGWSGSCTGSS